MSPGLRLSMKKVNREERRFCEMRAMSISKGGEAYVCNVMVRERPLPYFVLLTTLSSSIRWFKRMSEAIITRRGYGPEGKPTMHVDTITAVGTTVWNVPNSLRGSVKVLLFGGGAASTIGSYSGAFFGGGSGWMNNGEFSITPGSQINIVIGAGGIFGTGSTAGGTSSFGTYLSANGGSGQSGGTPAGQAHPRTGKRQTT